MHPLVQFPLLCIAFVIGIAISAGFIYLLYFLLTLPLRRKERARRILDLLELGLNDGRTPESALIDAAQCRDASLSAAFRRLAGRLKTGTRLSEALDQTPELLPPQVAAMLQAGERAGNVRNILPACRQVLQDSVSQVRSAINYVVFLGFAVTPLSVLLPFAISIVVLPKYKEVLIAMTPDGEIPPFTRLIFAGREPLMWIQVAIIFFIWLLILAYIAGPRLRGVLPGVVDRIQFHLPWRRRRLQRDFSAMLAVLLDSGVPESEAVRLAADATANRILRRRAEKVCAKLARGTRLPEAIRDLDESGELQWRLANALQRGRDFLRALAGWHEALDAKAFQLEQTAAQITTTALVLLNGFIIACIVIAVFLALINFLNQMTLW